MTPNPITTQPTNPTPKPQSSNLTPDQIDSYRSQLGIQTTPKAITPDKMSGSDLANHYLSLNKPQTNQEPSLENSGQTPGTAGTYLKNVGNDFYNSVKTNYQQVQKGNAIASKGGIGNELRGNVNNILATTGGLSKALFSPVSAFGESVFPQTEQEKQTGNTLIGDVKRGAMSAAPFGLVGGPAGVPIAAGIGGTLAGVFHGLNVLQTALQNNPKTAQFFKDNPDVLNNINNGITTGLTAFGLTKMIGSLQGGETPTDEPNSQPTEQPNEPIQQLQGESLASKGGNILNAARDYLTPMDENVKNVLTNGNPDVIEPKLTTLLDQAKNAVENTGEPTPYEITGRTQLGGALKDLGNQLSDLGSQKESIVENIDNLSSQDPEATANLQNIIDNSSKSLQTAVSKLGLKINEDGGIETQPNQVSVIPEKSADIGRLSQINDIMSQAQDNPTFKNINNAIDAMQEIAYKAKAVGAEPMSTELGGLIKQQIGALNSGLKDFASEYSDAGDYSQVNSDYAKTNDLYTQLNKRLGSNMNKAGSVIKSIFSSTDSGTKNLVTQLEDATGRPIFEDSTLSKFAMDVAEDPRARTLIAGQGTPPLTKGGLMSRVMDYIGNKVEDPTGKAMRILQSNREAGGGNTPPNDQMSVSDTEKMLNTNVERGVPLENTAETPETTAWNRELNTRQIQHDVNDIVGPKGSSDIGLQAQYPDIAEKIRNIDFPDKLNNTPEFVKLIQDNLTPEEFSKSIKDIYRALQTRVQTQKMMSGEWKLK